jgi:hypothetical protein
MELRQILDFTPQNVAVLGNDRDRIVHRDHEVVFEAYLLEPRCEVLPDGKSRHVAQSPLFKWQSSLWLS